MIRISSVALFLGAFASSLAGADPYLLASSRGGWVEAIDPRSLETVARIRTPRNTESAGSDAEGARLFIAAPRRETAACCAIFALDPATMQMTELDWPATQVTMAGKKVLVQRGDAGIDVFDAQTLQALPIIPSAASYRLQASPDGRAAFGIAYGHETALDLFNLVSGERVVSHVLPERSSMAGTFVGKDYYLFAAQPGDARLHHVRSDTGQFEETVVSLAPASFPTCGDIPYDAVNAGGKVAIYAQFGLKPAGACTAPSGYVLADPGSRSVTPRLANGLRFRQMISPLDDGALYALEVGSPAWQDVRILKLDAAGEIVAEKKLAPEVWRLTSGRFPEGLVGRLDLVAALPGARTAR